MDYVHSAFYEATGWTRDNSYAALNSTTDGAAHTPFLALAKVIVTLTLPSRL
jgi:hypothetical protein